MNRKFMLISYILKFSSLRMILNSTSLNKVPVFLFSLCPANYVNYISDLILNLWP